MYNFTCLVPKTSYHPVFDRFPVFAYCKQSKTGQWEVLGTRLQSVRACVIDIPVDNVNKRCNMICTTWLLNSHYLYTNPLLYRGHNTNQRHHMVTSEEYCRQVATGLHHRVFTHWDINYPPFL